MRTLPTLLFIFSLLHGQAQVVNGSFENGTAGWTIPCACAPGYVDTDVPGGTGTYALGLDNVNFSCLCMLMATVHQPTPWVTPGQWQFSAWYKSAVAGDQPGSRVSLNPGSPFSTPSISELWSYAGTWEYVLDTLVIDQSVLLDSVRISLVPDDGNMQPPSLSHFDDIQLTSLLSTGLADTKQHTPAFRPNPATDKLWIDLPETPPNVQLFDAQGRSVPLPRLDFNAHTLELNVEGLPPGLYVLSLCTPRGPETLRFVKQ